MARKRRGSERQRWVEIYRWVSPDSASGPTDLTARHRELTTLVAAFARVGRVVRVEPGKYSSSTVVLKARRA